MKIFAVKHLSRGWHLPVKAAITLTEKLKLALMRTAKVD
jgi:hypothetical protein